MMSAFMFPIYLATNKIQDQRERERERERITGKTEGTTEDREVWYQERPTVGPDRRERERQS